MTLEHDLLQLARDAMRSLMNGREFATGQTGHYLNIIRRIEDQLNRPKPEQEPVALKMVHGEVCCQSKHDDQSFGMWCPITEEEFPNGTPFYTAPPRKEWVGLTGEQLARIVVRHAGFPTKEVWAISEALKELNT